MKKNMLIMCYMKVFCHEQGRRMPRHKFSFTFLIQSYFQLLFTLRVDFFVSAYSREKIKLFSER